MSHRPQPSIVALSKEQKLLIHMAKLCVHAVFICGTAIFKLSLESTQWRNNKNNLFKPSFQSQTEAGAEQEKRGRHLNTFNVEITRHFKWRKEGVAAEFKQLNVYSKTVFLRWMTF